MTVGKFSAAAREALMVASSLTCVDVVQAAQLGLYAVHTTAAARRQLGIEADASLVYLGKSESSLLTRDVGSHFATGRTGQSTLRRSLAALLADDLGLVPVPRGAGKNATTDHALAPDGDAALTEWMRGHLTLAIWPKPVGCPPLAEVEREFLRELEPALNLTHVPRPWRELKSARAAMAARAAEYGGAHG